MRAAIVAVAITAALAGCKSKESSSHGGGGSSGSAGSGGSAGSAVASAADPVLPPVGSPEASRPAAHALAGELAAKLAELRNGGDVNGVEAWLQPYRDRLDAARDKGDISPFVHARLDATADVLRNMFRPHSDEIAKIIRRWAGNVDGTPPVADATELSMRTLGPVMEVEVINVHMMIDGIADADRAAKRAEYMTKYPVK